MNLKRTVLIFLILEFLDLITTLIGLRFGATEKNQFMSGLGFYGMIGLKLFVTLSAAFLMQRLKFGKIIRLVPTVAGLPVLWNVIVLLRLI
jgi:hypothetical protein